IECLATALSESSCKPDDLACICTDQPFLKQMEFCVSTNCTIKEALTTQNFTTTACMAPIRDMTRAINWTAIGGAILALTAVLLRLIQRLPHFGGKFGMDDVMIIASTAVMIPLSVLSEFCKSIDGLGKDIWTVPFDKITDILYIYYFDEPMYISSLALTKISILFFYLRIFSTRNFRYMVYMLMACDAAYIIGFDFALIFQCKPINFAWKKWDGEHSGTCVDANAIGWSAAACNIALDLLTIILPLPQIAKLQLSWGKKIPLLLVFALGFFVTIISCLRIKYIAQFANTQNVTWDYVPIGYWSTIEVQLSIIIACCPSLRALVIYFFPNFTIASTKAYSSKNRTKSSGVSTSASRLSIMGKDNFLPLQDFDSNTKAPPRPGIRVDQAFDLDSYNRSQGYV
ncbi:hypothetical protein NA57DRAFT_49239, partial [Rhizodiscina lignyota]